jgi:S-adenosylmethionine/arginine decarboxylase-like enzyme
LKPSAHLHLLINASILNPPGPDDCEKINAFMRGMVEHVRMKVMLDPVTAWCDEPGNEGITSTVILTTSHCAMHIWNLPDPEPSMMQFDLYSCAKFEVSEVFEYLSSYFDIVDASYKFLDRETGMIEIENGQVQP